jgi:ABC-type phosphate/phosphonate transport system substrate-binding protein
VELTGGKVNDEPKLKDVSAEEYPELRRVLDKHPEAVSTLLGVLESLGAGNKEVGALGACAFIYASAVNAVGKVLPAKEQEARDPTEEIPKWVRLTDKMAPLLSDLFESSGQGSASVELKRLIVSLNAGRMETVLQEVQSAIADAVHKETGRDVTVFGVNLGKQLN